MKKFGRNDPCPCGSGKKFKKCCESTMIGGKFRATKVDASNSPSITSASKIANLFKAQAPTLILPTQDFRPVKATVSENRAVSSSENAPEIAEKTEASEEGLEQKEDI